MELVEQVARIDEKVDNLEERFDRHEKQQNGSLERLEGKLDRFTWWLVLTLGGVTTTLILILVKGG